MIAAAERYIVQHNVANLYTEPDTSSPLATQAIMGAVVTGEGQSNGFRRITTEDCYGGWISEGLLSPIRDSSEYLTTTAATLFAEVYAAPNVQAELLTKFVVGSSVLIAHRAEVGDWVPVLLSFDEIGYIHRVSLNVTYSSPSENLQQVMESEIPRESILSAIGRQVSESAKHLIGTPYLWGGCTPFGIDCSGLTQLAYKLNGVQLLRDAHQQFTDRRFRHVEEGQGLESALLEEGDLVVFSRRDDKHPTHIGLALGDGRFLHARGGKGVRIDFCDTMEYVETYLGSVRLSADADLAIEAA